MISTKHILSLNNNQIGLWTGISENRSICYMKNISYTGVVSKEPQVRSCESEYAYVCTRNVTSITKIPLPG